MDSLRMLTTQICSNLLFESQRTVAKPKYPGNWKEHSMAKKSMYGGDGSLQDRNGFGEI